MITLSLFLGRADVGFARNSNYEDCVLEALKTAETTYEVNVVQRLCRNKFPSKEKYVPPEPRKKYEPELDRNGLEMCRVTPQGNGWEYLTKERLQTLKNMAVFELEKTSGQIASVHLPRKNRNDSELKKLTEWLLSEGRSIFNVCRRYHSGRRIYG